MIVRIGRELNEWNRTDLSQLILHDVQYGQVRKYDD